MIAVSGGVNIPNVDANQLKAVVHAALKTAGQRISGLVLRKAKENAPVSPTQAEINADRDDRRKMKMRKVQEARAQKAANAAKQKRLNEQAREKARIRAHKRKENAKARKAKKRGKTYEKKPYEPPKKKVKVATEKKTRKPLKTRVPKKTRTAKRTRAKNRPMPGGLERSISSVVEGTGDSTRVAVFVRDPSEAVKYADFIHNQKGTKWFKRGIGTRNKGEQADDKFIERAVEENGEVWKTMFEGAVANAVGKFIR